MRGRLELRRKMLIGLFGVVACSLSPGFELAPTATAEEPSLTKSTTVEGITEYRMDNGLQVLLYPDPSKATVTVNLTIFVGSRHEGYGEAGMAHLLEHMLFKGTPTHPNIPQLLKARGATFNGTTWLDRTNYYETLPATEDNLEFAIRLEADRFVNSYVKAEDLESEMSVVRNEFERGENSPSSVLYQRMLSAAYLWHNYGKSTIGNRADIERVPIDRLQDFYRRYYQPDNALLVIAGRFDTEQALGVVLDSFGKIPRPERKLPATYTEEPAQDGERLVTLRRVGDVAVVGAVYHIPAGAHPDFAAVSVLTRVLASEPAGKLYKALVEKRIAANVYGSAFDLHDPGIVMFMAEVAAGNDPNLVLENLIDTVEGLAHAGISEEDVARARLQIAKQIELAESDTTRSAVQLSEWASKGDWRLKFLYRDRVEKVTVEDVQRVAAAYLTRNNRTAGVYLPVEKPQRVTVPATPSLAEMIGEYRGREDVAAGEVFDVSPQNIQQRTQFVTLPSGVKAALLPKKTRGGTVNIQLTLRYGSAESLHGMKIACEYLPQLMMRGTKELDRQQIQDGLDRTRTRMHASGGAGSMTFTIETKREQLADVLKLLKHVLRSPTLPESELELLKQEQIAGLEQQLTDPTTLAQTTVSRAINPYPAGDPRYIATTEEEIALTKSLDRATVERLFTDYVNGAHGELVVIGDFDPEQTTDGFREILVDWKSKIPFAPITRTGKVDVQGSFTAIETPDKANATYFAGDAFPLRDTSPDYAALIVGNYILGGGALSSRLGDRVRQQEGLSYGIGSGVRAGSIDDRGIFYVYAISNPENMARLRPIILEELQRFLKSGVTEEELEAAKKGYLQSLMVARTKDSSLARVIGENLQADRDMSYQQELENRVESLTPEMIVETARRYLDPKELIIVAAGDFASVKKSEQGAPAAGAGK